MPTISEVIRPVRSSSRRLGRRRGRLDIRPGDIVYIDAKGYEGYAIARGVSEDELVFTPLVTIWDPASVALGRICSPLVEPRYGGAFRSGNLASMWRAPPFACVCACRG